MDQIYTGCKLYVKRNLHPGAFHPGKQSCKLHPMAKKRTLNPGDKPPHFIREWRKFNHLSLVQVADRLANMDGDLPRTAASLSRVERYQQAYTQDMLTALAYLFHTDAGSILMRNPSQPESIWSLWDKAEPGERLQIQSFADTVLKYRGQ